MKKNVIILIACLSTIMAGAQDSEVQTLFGQGTRISGMGGPLMSFSSVRGEFAHMMGGGGGVLLGDLFIGGYGEGLTTPVVEKGYDPLQPGIEQNIYTEFGHGGFWVGYSLLGNMSIHPTISTQLGWGAITQGSNYISDYEDGVFVINPAVELEMNFTRFFRLGIGAHYRIVRGIQHIPGFDDNDFTSPGAFLSFKFGWF